MPIFAHVPLLQRLTGLIYFPINHAFPHFGLAAGLMYLPAKFKIRFLEPIHLRRLWTRRRRRPRTRAVARRGGARDASSAKSTQRFLSGSPSGSVRVPPQGMRGMRQNGGWRLAATALCSGTVMLAISACGGDDHFKNEARPPVPTQLTGVITNDEVTVSPNTVPLPAKKGQQEASRELNTPIILIISNQTTTRTRSRSPARRATAPSLGRHAADQPARHRADPAVAAARQVRGEGGVGQGRQPGRADRDGDADGQPEPSDLVGRRPAALEQLALLRLRRRRLDLALRHQDELVDLRQVPAHAGRHRVEDLARLVDPARSRSSAALDPAHVLHRAAAPARPRRAPPPASTPSASPRLISTRARASAVGDLERQPRPSSGS